jgi:hypothetical protein
MDSPRIRTTDYTPSEWAKLSPAQKSHILNARGAKCILSAFGTAYSDMFDDTFGQEYAVTTITDQKSASYLLPIWAPARVITAHNLGKFLRDYDAATITSE